MIDGVGTEILKLVADSIPITSDVASQRDC